jgi:hypothetical protein
VVTALKHIIRQAVAIGIFVVTVGVEQLVPIERGVHQVNNLGSVSAQFRVNSIRTLGCEPTCHLTDDMKAKR